MSLAGWMLFFSVIGAFVSVIAAAYAKRQATAAEGSAEAADRAAKASERSATANEQLAAVEREKLRQSQAPHFLAVHESEPRPRVAFTMDKGPARFCQIQVELPVAHNVLTGFYEDHWPTGVGVKDLGQMRMGDTRYADVVRRLDTAGDQFFFIRCDCKDLEELLASASVHIPAIAKSPDVVWQLTKLGGYGFLLRNVGADAARGVTIDEAQIMQGVFHRDLPNGIEIPAGASHQFLIQGTWGKSVPAELRVTWDGGPPGGQLIPVPLR